MQCAQPICWNGSWTNHCVARSNDPADQEKAIVYNELVTNAVALQNVVDQTQANLLFFDSKPSCLHFKPPRYFKLA
jgi:hypothetical protein